MHGPGVSGDVDVQTLQDGGEAEEVGDRGEVDGRRGRQRSPDDVDDGPIRSGSRQDDRCTVLLNEAGRDLGEALRIPLLDGPSSASVQSDERPAGAAEQLAGTAAR